MKKCAKCGLQVNSPIHYCPFCGTLLPGEKEMVLVSEEDYVQAIKASDCIEVDPKEWNEMVSFYQSHLSTGYAPKGKQLVSKSEMAQLRKDNQEYEQAKKINGTDLYGRLYCKVTQRRQTRTRIVGIEDYWKKKIKKGKKYDRWSIVVGVFMFITMIPGMFYLLYLIVEYGWLGVLLSSLIGVPFGIGYNIYVNKVLD